MRTTTTIPRIGAMARTHTRAVVSVRPAPRATVPDSGAVKTLKATLELYRAAIQDGARAYGRGIVGAFGLLLGSAVLLLVSTVLGPLIAPFGYAGSLLFGLFFSVLVAYVFGAYLACVESALDARTMLAPSTL